VRFCADAGITQFLDIGSGLPTNQNVHQVAEQFIADPRVVYVDNDPVEYSLTELGHSANVPLAHLRNWALDNISRVPSLNPARTSP